MDWIAILVGIFLMLLLLGFPVFVALSIPSLVYLLFNEITASTMSYKLIEVLNQFPLVAVPLFILMGNLANKLGVADQIYRLSRVIYRYREGWSLKVNVFMSLIFSGISGTALADICGLGPIEIEAGVSEGFDRPFVAALTAATSIIGPIFPPSVPLIIYAMVAEVSTVRVLLAGIIPALLLAVLFYGYILYIAPRKIAKSSRNISRGEFGHERFLTVIFETSPILLLVPLVIISMMIGLFSPSEAGAAGVVYVILLGAYYRKITLRKLAGALFQSVISTATVLIMLTAALFLASILLREGLADFLSNGLLNISRTPFIMLTAINIMLIILGCFVEGLTVIFLVTPIILPIIKEIGVDPVHLGVVMVLNVMIGTLTPPFGVSLYAIQDVAKLSTSEITRELVPLILLVFGGLLIITAFPAISLWVPNMAFGG